ncbi:translation initiation factor IF-2 [Anopheles sinensis]|uniref:Translation initiation factor IF-2 n=1 Tax=Anopheles sinensis TaxID=74873 RepID=A0A084VA75_ANOSI|nr:translation initiation factor IF-2 [Anopheles sinensis]
MKPFMAASGGRRLQHPLIPLPLPGTFGPATNPLLRPSPCGQRNGKLASPTKSRESSLGPRDAREGLRLLGTRGWSRAERILCGPESGWKMLISCHGSLLVEEM